MHNAETQTSSTHFCIEDIADRSIHLASSPVIFQRVTLKNWEWPGYYLCIMQKPTSSTYFYIEDIADNDAAVNFYTGFSDYCTLMICFEFLGKAIYHLKYWGSISRSLSPMNEFLCCLRCGLMEKDSAFRFKVS